MEKINKWVIITAIIVLGMIEIVAMTRGINGQLRTLIAVIIAGLAGWVVPLPQKR